MKILIISDLHFELDYHHNVFEGEALEWLINIIRRHKPDALIGLGDWGHGWTIENWNTLQSLLPVYAIYGNHENLPLLEYIKDAGIRVFDDLKFGFINGIIAKTSKIKDDTPQHSVEEYIFYGSLLARNKIDVLCTHASPLMDDETGRFHGTIDNNMEFNALARIREMIKPILWLSGHLSGPYHIGKIGETLNVRVDSSPKDKHYILLDTKDKSIEIWNDNEKVKEIAF